MRITKRFKLDLAHRIWNQQLPDGMPCKCIQLHGHTCHVEITIEGPIKNGMVIDFNILKRIINKIEEMYDHKTLIDENDPLSNKFKDIPGIVYVPFVPTAENLAMHIMDIVQNELPHDYKCVKVKWYETETAWAEFEKL